MKGVQTLQVQTEVRGPVPDNAVDLAVRKVRSLLRLAPEPVLFVRVRLIMATDPAVERPVTAQVHLDLNGRPIRAEAVAGTIREAITRVCDRLRIRLDRAARNWAALRGGKVARETAQQHGGLAPASRQGGEPSAGPAVQP